MLTEIKVKTAKPLEKDYRLTDSKGLYLIVTSTGKKYWRYDYRYKGKRKTISLGVYPDVSLKDVRIAHEESRRLLREKIDPSEARKKDKIGNETLLFNDIATKWFEDNKNKWLESHSKTIYYRLESYVKSTIGKKAITDISRADILTLLKDIDKTGKVETAKRVKMIISSIYQYAIDLEIIDKDPTVNLTKHLSPTKTKHYPTLLSIPDIKKLIKAIDDYWGNNIIKGALKFLMLTFVRPGELRLAEWKEFDLQNAVWDIPAGRMKIKNRIEYFYQNKRLIY